MLKNAVRYLDVFQQGLGVKDNSYFSLLEGFMCSNVTELAASICSLYCRTGPQATFRCT